MNMNFAKFPAPVLGDGAEVLYSNLYGVAGEQFVEILNTSPDEIAVISRLIAYLTVREGMKEDESTENCKGNWSV